MDSHKARNDEKYEAMRAAKELEYGPEVVEQIRQAKTPFEIGKILKTARDKPVKKLNEKYRNILFLHDELVRAGIPHKLKRVFDGWIIIYEKDGIRIGDVITHFFSYGHKTDLMEAYGFPECEGDVMGNLNVDEAFELFKNAHER